MTALPEIQPVPHAPGFRVAETDTHWIDVVPQIFNWRLQTVRKSDGEFGWAERFWCYEGKGLNTLQRAVAAARVWDGADNTEPQGWSKNGQTQEWRPAQPEPEMT